MARVKSSFVLRRVHADGSEEEVSRHGTLDEGWRAGTHSVHVKKADAFSLYEGSRRVAKFGHARLMPRATSFDWSVLG